jgi:hypothetical protein
MIEAIIEVCQSQRRTSPQLQRWQLPIKTFQAPVYFTGFLGEASTKSQSFSSRPSICPTTKNTTKKPLQGLLIAFNPRAEDHGSTYLGIRSLKGAVPAASTQQFDSRLLRVVPFDPPSRWPIREREDLMYEAGRSCGKLTQRAVGGDLEIQLLPPLRGPLDLELADGAPASFFSVSGPFSGSGRLPGTTTIIYPNLHPWAKSSLLWVVKFHGHLPFQRCPDLAMSLRILAGWRFCLKSAAPTTMAHHRQTKACRFGR